MSAQLASQGRSAPTSPIPAGEVRDAQARFGALRSAPSSDVRVTEEHVAVRCEDSAGAFLLCELEARWVLVSPRAQTVQLYATSVGVEGTVLAQAERTTDVPALTPLSVTFAPDLPLEVVLRGRARLRETSGTTDALDARHPLLATARRGPHASLFFTRAIARTFDAIPPAPSVSASFSSAQRFRARALDTELDNTPQPLDATALAERANVPIILDREEGFPLRHGGPFLGLGGTFDRGVMGRIGYELGIDELVIVGVALDTDFTESVTLGAVIEVATPSFIVPPSLAAGVGFAYRWFLGAPDAGRPRQSAGLRLEASAVFSVIGIVASFDYFPDDGAFTSSLLGRLSL